MQPSYRSRNKEWRMKPVESLTYLRVRQTEPLQVYACNMLSYFCLISVRGSTADGRQRKPENETSKTVRTVKSIREDSRPRSVSKKSKPMKKLSLVWEQTLRKFSQANQTECKNFGNLDFPKVERSTKMFPTGSQYQGTWDVLGMSGSGSYTFPNGVIYEGQMYDGMFHGNGELKYPNGVVVRGTWNKGEITQRTLVFANGLEYDENGWDYCKMPDRRFAIEYEEGFQPVGKEFMTADQPPRELPYGYYDIEDGFYSPHAQIVFKQDDLDHILRAPVQKEQDWIKENCRLNPLKTMGPCPRLYEEWSEPRMEKIKNPTPPVRAKHIRATQKYWQQPGHSGSQESEETELHQYLQTRSSEGFLH